MNTALLEVSDESGVSISATRVSNTATQYVFSLTPANAGTARVRLTASGGSVDAPPITILAPLPSITGFTPLRARSGDVVTIVGANLDGVTSVRLGGTPASIVAGSNTATQVQVTVGAGASGVAQVVTPGGTATSRTTFVFDASARPPVITGFSPTSGPIGTRVTIMGTGFSSDGLSVYVAWRRQDVVSVSPTAIVLAISPATSGLTGFVEVWTSAGYARAGSNFTCTVPTMLAAPTPILPANGAAVSSTANSYTNVDFSWSSVAGATSYSYQFAVVS